MLKTEEKWTLPGSGLGPCLPLLATDGDNQTSAAGSPENPAIGAANTVAGRMVEEGE
jgi:hypothetical protein